MRHLELVFEVPQHGLQVRHARHVPVGIVCVSFVLGLIAVRLQNRAGQPVVLRAGLQEAAFVVHIRACPTGIRWIGAVVNHLLEISNLIIDVLLDIAPHGIAVARM